MAAARRGKIPAGNEKRIPAGDGDPFSLRGERIPGSFGGPVDLTGRDPKSGPHPSGADGEGERDGTWDGTLSHEAGLGRLTNFLIGR
jgi:hypothetical protein